MLSTRSHEWTDHVDEWVAGATALIGLLGYTKTTFRTFWAFPVLALYPLSIFTVWGLDTLGFR